MTFVVQLTGRLTEDQLESALAPVGSALDAGQRHSLVVDCLEMSDYDSRARAAFVAWNARYRPHIPCVAVVTTKRLWHMVVSAMSLASGQRMKAFDALAEAKAWADGAGAGEGEG